jgi:hypothetical protein
MAAILYGRKEPKMPADAPTTGHEKLYEDALNAINLLFSDNSVSEVTTRASLVELKGEINVMLDALGVDLEDEAVSDEELLEEEDDEEEDEDWEEDNEDSKV